MRGSVGRSDSIALAPGGVDASVHVHVRGHRHVARAGLGALGIELRPALGGERFHAPKPPQMPSQPVFHMPSSTRRSASPRPPRAAARGFVHPHTARQLQRGEPRWQTDESGSGGGGGSDEQSSWNRRVVPFHVSQRGFYNHYHNSYRRRRLPEPLPQQHPAVGADEAPDQSQGRPRHPGEGGCVADPEAERPAPSRPDGGGREGGEPSRTPSRSRSSRARWPTWSSQKRKKATRYGAARLQPRRGDEQPPGHPVGSRASP